MPLLTIHSLPPADWDADAIPRMLADIRDSGARALRSTPDNIWVIFHPVTAGYYVQGEKPAATAQQASHPPVVIIRAQSGRQPAEREAFVTAVAAAVGRGLSVPAENVWIYYDEMRPQDVWFGGRWAG